MADNSNTSSTQPGQLPLKTRLKLHIHRLTKLIGVRPDGTINRRLYGLLDIKSPAPATKLITTTTKVSTSDVPINASTNLWFRLFSPTTTDDKSLLPLIVYFHGGGFSSYGPDSKTFDNLCCHVAARVPAVVASINYRLAPEHRYPTQYEDGFDALKFIDAEINAFLPAITDFNNCFIAGDSAGGNIAHHVTVRALQNPNQFKKIKLAGLLALQPFFGGEERTESELRLTNAPILNVERTDWMWRNFLPEGADRDHPAVNVFGKRVDCEASETVKSINYPSTLVIVGGSDPLQDWQRRYAQGLEKCGKQVEMIEYPNAFHGFYGFPELAEFNMLIDDIREFVQNKVHSS